MKRLAAYLSILVLAVLVASCAQTGVLSGGEKDTSGPVFYDTASLPPNYATNFNSRMIVLEFNEYIRLKNVQQQVVISPPFPEGEDPKFVVRKKSLEIYLPEGLRENTTYTINFGDAIEDITESNKARNLKYVFSTGDFIDSLSLRGSVRMAENLAPAKETLVMLHENLSDTAPQTERPLYFTKTDERGNFQIDFIKEGTYQIVALQDGNFNYLYDLPTEAFAFSDETITLPQEADSTRQPLTLKLFATDPVTQYIDASSYNNPGVLTIMLGIPAKDLQVKPLNGPENWFDQKRSSVRGDTVTWWLNSYRPDTLLLEVSDGDSLLNDSLVLPLRYDYKDRRRTEVVEPRLKGSTNAKGNFDWHRPLQLRFNYPVANISKDSIKVVTDSVAVPFTVSRGDSVGLVWLLNVAWEPKTTYRAQLLPGGATDVYGKTNQDTIQDAFVTQAADHYARLEVDVKLPAKDHPFVLQLQNDKGQVVQEHAFSEDQIFEFEYLPPGKYGIKLIYDENGNQRWDTGHYDDKRQPERIIYFDQSIELLSNWEQSWEWIITE